MGAYLFPVKEEVIWWLLDEELIFDWNFELAEAYMEQIMYCKKPRKGSVKNWWRIWGPNGLEFSLKVNNMDCFDK